MIPALQQDRWCWRRALVQVSIFQCYIKDNIYSICMCNTINNIFWQQQNISNKQKHPDRQAFLQISLASKTDIHWIYVLFGTQRDLTKIIFSVVFSELSSKSIRWGKKDRCKIYPALLMSSTSKVQTESVVAEWTVWRKRERGGHF